MPVLRVVAIAPQNEVAGGRIQARGKMVRCQPRLKAGQGVFIEGRQPAGLERASQVDGHRDNRTHHGRT